MTSEHELSRGNKIDATSLRQQAESKSKPWLAQLAAIQTLMAQSVPHQDVLAAMQEMVQELNTLQIEREQENEALRCAISERDHRLETQKRLIELTGEVGKIGGWQVDLSNMELIWTRETFRISERDSLDEPALEQGINLFAPSARPVIAAAVQAAIERGTSYDLELPIITEKGNHRWVRTQGWAITEQGKRTRLIGTFQDITKEKDTAEAFAHLNLLHASVFDSLSEQVAVLDRNGVIISVNQAWKKIAQSNGVNIHSRLGIGANYLSACGASVDETAMRTFTGIQSVLSGNKALFTMQYSCQLLTEQRWFQLRVMPMVMGGGVVVSHADITEQKVAELIKHSTFQELENFQSALDQHAIVAVTDANGIITFVNEKFIAISGYSRFEILGHDHRIVNSGFHPKEVFVELWSTIKRGKVWHGELRNRAKNGNIYWVSTTIAPLINTDGVVQGFIAIRTDITQQKLVAETLIKEKQEVERLNDELQRRIEQANLLTEKAEQASAAKSAFVANMSHEIRTPMNGVMGMLEVLIGTPLSAEQKDYALTAYHSAEGLLSIVNDILDFSKIEACHLVLKIAAFDLHDLIFDLMAIFRAQAMQSSVELLVDIKTNVPRQIFGDAGRIRQIVINLIGNALKFTKVGFVRLDVSYTQPCISLAIRDSGIGIPADQIHQLFSAFTQVDVSTTRQHGGTGLGLAISRRLAELMQGKITVASIEGQGSTFTLTLPVRVPERAQPSDFTSDDLPMVSELCNKRILVVDDHEMSAEIVCEQLNQMGAIGEFCSDGTKALKKLQEAAASATPFAAAIVDLRLPGMKGDDIALAIRGDQQLVDLPLLMLTGSGQPDEPAAMAKAGFNAYLVKPVRFAVLKNVLERVISADPSSPREMIQNSNDADLINSNSVKLQMHNTKVLLVEDNDINAKIVLSALNNLGAETSLADNGRQALKLMENNHFDIVLMDCQMPEMDGFEATTLIRVREKQSGAVAVPIIAMTANAMNGSLEKCLAVGMNDYLSKPFKRQQLEAKIRKWLPDYKTTTESLSTNILAASDQLKNSPLTKTPVFDLSCLRDIEMTNAGIGLVVARAFLVKLPQEVAAIRVQLSVLDLTGINRLAHKLKGSSGSVGALEIQAMTDELEAVTLLGDIERCRTLVAALEQASTNFVRQITLPYLEQCLSSLNPPNPNDLTE